ncbi:monovalent cation/H(+) antiporter subunit G [Planctomycetota bacterium]|nr:monovalent cation/H(+) antiporter subunit G [Planctomycetota bacterium]
MSVADIIVAVLLVLGCLVSLSCGVGLLRFPDFYTRLHPAGKTDTLGQILILGALIVAAGLSQPQVSLKLALIALFLLITTPTSTHALTRAAHVDRRQPWKVGDPE